jgi:hypothetical protein
MRPTATDHVGNVGSPRDVRYRRIGLLIAMLACLLFWFAVYLLSGAPRPW